MAAVRAAVGNGPSVLGNFGKKLRINDKNKDKQLPEWSQKLFKKNEVTDACRLSTLEKADCVPQVVENDIYIGDKFSRKERLALKEDDQYKKVRDMKARKKELLDISNGRDLNDEEIGEMNNRSDISIDEKNRLVANGISPRDLNKEEQQELKAIDKVLAGFPIRSVTIRNASGALIDRIVENPYIASEYREDTGTNFSNPVRPMKEQMQHNVNLLNDLVPQEMIVDKPMAISILESLWFCGQNPTISNDPRCFPARLLGELREYQRYRAKVAAMAKPRSIEQIIPIAPVIVPPTPSAPLPGPRVRRSLPILPLGARGIRPLIPMPLP